MAAAAAARVLRVCFELRVVQRFKRVSSEGVESVFEECAWEQGGRKRLKRVAHKQLILQQGLVVNQPSLSQ